MKLTEELLSKLIEKEKWNENPEVYKEELLNLLLIRSDRFLSVEDWR